MLSGVLNEVCGLCLPRTRRWPTWQPFDVSVVQDGSDAVRAAQAAAAKALSGSHGSGGSLARTGSSSSLSGRQARPRDPAGPAAQTPAGVLAPRAQSDAPRPANDGRVAAGSEPRTEAASAASAGQPPQASDCAMAAQPARVSDWATEVQPELQPAAAASSEEPEAPVTPSLGAEKVICAAYPSRIIFASFW